MAEASPEHQFTVSEALWTLLSAADGGSDEAERARLIATGIPSLTGCDLSAVALVDERQSWTLIGQKDGSEIDEVQAATVLPDLEPLFLEALERGHLLVVAADLPASLANWGLVCLVVVPLLTLRTRLGALLVARATHEPPGPELEFVLSRLAEQTALGLENLRLGRALKRHTENLEALVEARTAELGRSEKKNRMLLDVNRAVSTHRKREDLFRAIASAVTGVVPFDRLSVFINRPEADEMTVYVVEAEAEGSRIQAGVRFPLEGTAPGWVVRTQRPFVGSSLEDLEPYPVSYEVLEKEGINSNCLLPLIVDERSIGVLLFLAKRPGRYDSVDLVLLQEMADAIAVALDDSLAYEEISRLKDRLTLENVYLREEIKTQHDFEEIVGRSRPMQKVFKAVETVAPTGANVLLTGETGTGKELIARAVHNLSDRKDKALVKVNCAAVPRELVESEFFGHEKGAFTGAVSRKVGRFELASGGTILLDEIGDLPLDLQAKLLRVLQDGEFERVGGSQTIGVDVRVIAATNRDLDSAIHERRFRPDLYYRLNVFPISLPPLRDRAGDIPALIQHFIAKSAAKLGKRIDVVPRKTMSKLEAYSWPGNVRELENLIERAVIVSTGPELQMGDWLPTSPPAPDMESVGTLEEVSRRHIVKVLENAGWRVSGERGAAAMLGLKPTTLESRMKKLGIARPRSGTDRQAGS